MTPSVQISKSLPGSTGILLAAVFFAAMSATPAFPLDVGLGAKAGGLGVGAGVGLGRQGASVGLGADVGDTAGADAGASVGRSGAGLGAGASLGGTSVGTSAAVGSPAGGGSSGGGSSSGGGKTAGAQGTKGTVGAGTSSSPRSHDNGGNAQPSAAPQPGFLGFSAMTNRIRPATAGLVSLPSALRPIRRGGLRLPNAVPPLAAVLGTPRNVVRSCRLAIAAAAQPLGSVRVEAVSAGRPRQREGGLSAPIFVRIHYAQQTGIEIRQARVDCRIDDGGRVLTVI